MSAVLRARAGRAPRALLGPRWGARASASSSADAPSASSAPATPTKTSSLPPPPGASSWREYADRAQDRPQRRPPRLRELDPTGYYGGYYQTISATSSGAEPNADAADAADARGARAPAQTWAEKFAAPAEPPPPPPPRESEGCRFVRSFAMRPKDVVERLNEYVIGQDAAKRTLAVAVCDHFNHARRCLEDPSAESAERAKPNVLLVGPTGSGKTFLVRTLARLVDAPFVQADATKFSATGFVGRDTDELVHSLVDAAGGDLRAAAHGIVFVDEVDKLCARHGLAGMLGGGGGGVNTRDVQTSLLKLMEDADVPLDARAPGAPPAARAGRAGADGAAEGGRRLSTRHVLWVFSGAFNEMHARLAADEAREDAAEDAAAAAATAAEDDHGGGTAAPPPPADAAPAPRRAPPSGGAQREATRRLRARARESVGTAHLVDAGLEPEFIGRLPVRVRCTGLSEDDYVNILLHSKASALAQLADSFKGYGIELTISQSAVRQLARLAMAQGTGARGLVTAVEATFRDLKYELPSAGVTHFFVDEEMVADPHAALEALLVAEAAQGAGGAGVAGRGGGGGEDGAGPSGGDGPERRGR